MICFSTKAQTLQALEGVVQKSVVLPQIQFTRAALKQDPNGIAAQVLAKFPGQALIVRSSALNEDTAGESGAGKYLSVQNVPAHDVLAAAHTVADSYGDDNPAHQILVQPMLRRITASDVLFTMDPNTGGQYYVINFNRENCADAITSGRAAAIEAHYVFRGHRSPDASVNRVIDAAQELMTLFSHDCIDIEFAFAEADQLYLLQARPLVMRVAAAQLDLQRAALERTYHFIRRQMQPKPYLGGNRTIYGVMPDWNPAEMIGIRPKPLTISLYRRLITDGTWAFQRDNYGYRNLRSFPLMVDFCGLPYIDTRVSFNSFVPKALNDTLSAKLVDYYLDSLAIQPDKHDKVEFDIIYSCYTFDLPQRIKALGAHGFTRQEQETLEQALRRLTNTIINIKDGLWITDSAKIQRLIKRQQLIAQSGLDTVSKIYWLLEDCARYGTLPFAGLARAGFIAVQLLKSLVCIGILSQTDYQRYMGQLNTVGSQMSSDWQTLSRAAFLERYCHLRPGTYDITSMRYDAAPALYFGDKINHPPVKTHPEPAFSLTLEQYEAIQSNMERQGLSGDVLALFKFLQAGIEGREMSKFVFSRSLSDALELFAHLGADYGFTREQMAFADCAVIDRLYSTTDDVKALLTRSIEEGMRKYEQTLTLSMPPVILTPEDLYCFCLPAGTPNFITLRTVTGETCVNATSREAIRDKILLIPAADPGYDWIFSCGIRGFITTYGGANSHMAIRAGELGVPAVIGAGETLFRLWSSAQVLRIDCANQKVEIIR